MNNLPKQDRNGVRTPTDIERRYKLSELDKVGDTATRIDNLETSKVDKVSGKNLSTNDFTNGYKTQVEENTQARHTHDKTDEELSGAVNDAHTHDNKDLLDTYNQTNANLVDAVNMKHEHDNKDLLDSYTNSDSDISDAIDNSHYHSNKSYLDAITGGTSSISLSSYLGSGFSLLRGTCVTKNRRVCINAVVSGAISARTTATIFDLPSSLSPNSQKDGVAFGTTSSGSTCGWYNVSTSGVVSVWYPEAVTTYTRVNIVYDIDY